MKSFRERRPALVGVASLVLIAVGLYFAFSINKFQGLRGVYTIKAELEDAAGLQNGNEVRVAGVKVGRITAISLTERAALVTMEIENDVRLPAETRVEVKLKTILGQKFVDLQFPSSFLAAASGEGGAARATEGFLGNGDVIPRSQTAVPYEVYQAATQGAEVLEAIDKAALRRLIDILANTVSGSKEELGRALVSLSEAGTVLEKENRPIRELLANARRLTGTLAGSDEDVEGILLRASEVLDVLARRRATTSSLLAATDELTANLALLIRGVRGSVEAGTADLNTLLASVQGDLGDLEAALAELGTAQELFGQNIKFGRFIEGHVCAITTEDTCVPEGSPSVPGVPNKGTQPSPAPRPAP